MRLCRAGRSAPSLFSNANPPPDIDDPKSQLASLVTGANSGIGKATARGLADRGDRVFMLCRSEERGEAARTDLIEATENEQIELVLCDLADLSDVRRAAADVRERADRLDVLVNNAGIYRGRHAESADGLEMTWAVNHFAPFLLANELRPLLMETAKAHGEARVVNVSSDVHRRAPALDFSEVERGGPSAEDFGGMRAYAQSKLANVLFTRAWAARHKMTGLTANAVHPGVVATNIWSDPEGWLATVAGWFTFFYDTPEKGAAGPLHLATSATLEGASGGYFNKTKPQAPAKEARSDVAARRLWEVTEKVVERAADTEAGA